MRLKLLVSTLLFATMLTVFTGCSGQPLDYDTALSLIKDRNAEPVQIKFSAAPPTGNDPAAKEAYDKLIDAHVLICTATKGMGRICQPGPAGEAVSQSGASDLALVAGRWVPNAVASISRQSGSNATAEVRMSFEMSPLYRDFENAFDAIQLYAGKSAIEAKKEGKIVHAVYHREDDGWHLESVS